MTSNTIRNFPIVIGLELPQMDERLLIRILIYESLGALIEFPKDITVHTLAINNKLYRTYQTPFPQCGAHLLSSSSYFDQSKYPLCPLL